MTKDVTKAAVVGTTAGVGIAAGITLAPIIGGLVALFCLCSCCMIPFISAGAN